MTPEVWAALVGLFLPPIISWLKSCNWPPQARYAFSLAICTIVGAATAYITDPTQFDPNNALGSAAACFVAAQTVYKLYFEGTSADTRLTG